MKNILIFLVFLYFGILTHSLNPSDPWIGGLPWNRGSVTPITIPEYEESGFLQFSKGGNFIERKEMKLNVRKQY